MSGTGGAGSGGASTDPAGSGGAGSAPSSVEIDCDATMPTGGTQTSNTWAQGGKDNLAWQIWSNGGPGNITTFPDTPAFIASWNNSGDYLGRMGFEWGNAGKPYADYGTIKADYVWNKTGTAGQYSYIGVYGWSNNPCVEWYIVEDSFHMMPFNTGDQPVGTAEVDGGTYNLVHRHTSGTGGDRCGGAGSWDQYYSIRLEGKRCGTITVSDHFDVWAKQGWNLGSLLEVKLVVEAAAGTGSVEFPLANVTTSK
jgi:endo-1,4-beta-xylanase